jgi:hypothetical protein
LERLGLAQGAAGMPSTDGGIKSVDALVDYQALNTRPVGTEGANAPPVPPLGTRSHLVGLRKQPPGIEGDDVDQEGPREDRMGDGLVLNSEARGEYNPAPHNVSYGLETLGQIKIKVGTG